MKTKTLNKGGVNGIPEGYKYSEEDLQVFADAVEEKISTYSSKQIFDNKLFSLRRQIIHYLENEKIENIITLSTFLKKGINAYQKSPESFAKYAQIKESQLRNLLEENGKINAPLALKLGRIFNTNPVLWLKIQIKNEIIEMEQELANNAEKYEQFSPEGFMMMEE